jgi:hypothetical protein
LMSMLGFLFSSAELSGKGGETFIVIHCEDGAIINKHSGMTKHSGNENLKT